jgi:hypothetical protein
MLFCRGYAAAKADAVDWGVRAATVLPFVRAKAGVWTADADGVRWIIDALFEPGYGPGVFRVGWGVIVPGAAAAHDGRARE